MEIVERIVGFFVNKKKVVGWAAALVMLIGGAAMSMSTQEFKDAVCAAPVLDLPQAGAPQPTPVVK